MRIPMTCRCGLRMRVPGEYAGRKVRCKKCGAAATVPASSPARSQMLGSASALFDVTPEPAAAPKSQAARRIELLPDERLDALVPDGPSTPLLAELGRNEPVPWYDLPRLAREATEAGIALTVAPRRR